MTHVDLVLSPNQSTVETFLVCVDNYFYLNYFPLKILIELVDNEHRKAPLILLNKMAAYIAVPMSLKKIFQPLVPLLFDMSTIS